MESNTCNELQKTDGNEKTNSRVRIHIHSKRRRLADPDNIDAKAAIDGLVCGGLLPSDSHRYVASVSYSQEQSEIEETIVTIETVEGN